MRRKTEEQPRPRARSRAEEGAAAPDPDARQPDPAQDNPKQSQQPSPTPEQPQEAEPDPTDQPRPEEQPAAGQDTPSDPAARIASLEQQLMDARCRLSAYAAGVAPELVEDAVTLAVQAARSKGPVTGQAVADAMEQVLRRHPGWRADSRRAGGFRLGADPGDRADSRSRPEPEGKKRWNRFR